jgi:hypothetical protein
LDILGNLFVGLDRTNVQQNHLTAFNLKELGHGIDFKTPDKTVKIGSDATGF